MHTYIDTSQNNHSKRCTQTACPGNGFVKYTNFMNRHLFMCHSKTCLNTGESRSTSSQREQDFLPQPWVLNSLAGLLCAALPNLVQCPQSPSSVPWQSVELSLHIAQSSLSVQLPSNLFHFLHIDLISISTGNLFCEVSPESLL